MKETILQLRAEGKSYNEIVAITGASKGTIAYHCSESVRRNYHHRQSNNRRKGIDAIKLECGGKCSNPICGYDKCLAALEFHHPKDNKEDSVSNLYRSIGKSAARHEAKKCVLVCANCHREIHEGVLTLD